MAQKVTKSSGNSQLTLHQLLGALSFWGSATRLLLISFFVISIFALKLAYLDTNITWEVQVGIYVLGSFALLDISYVMLARAFPLRRTADTWCLLSVEIFLVAAYVLPYLIAVRGLSWFINWLLLVVLFVISVRGLLGILFSTKKRV